MTAVSEDATADLNRRIAELEQRLETALIERDAEIERQTANALVNFRLQSELRATAERRNPAHDRQYKGRCGECAAADRRNHCALLQCRRCHHPHRRGR